ncbi:MAG: DRTGG domain-containing protein [Bacteroidales bacterium]
MKIIEVAKILDAKVLCGEGMQDMDLEFAFASDLMSDVLTIEKDRVLLLTGLANVQAIRTAEMSDINCVVIVRSKRITDEMVELAKEGGIVLIQSEKSMFKASGLLFEKGLKPIF